MQKNAELMRELEETVGYSSKVDLLTSEFITMPDPERGQMLAALMEQEHTRQIALQSLAHITQSSMSQIVSRLHHQTSPYSSFFVWLETRTKAARLQSTPPKYKIDAVLLFAQRGYSDRSCLYSDFTFGVWNDAALLPVGRIFPCGSELERLDRFIRDNSLDRIGPVRAVRPELVLEISFSQLDRAARPKSGILFRDPKLAAICDNRAPQTAACLDDLHRLLVPVPLSKPEQML